MVTVDVQGIREIQDEFELMPRELERALQRTVAKVLRISDTAIRRDVRAATGVDVPGSKVRVKRGRVRQGKGSLWGGLDTIPVDYLRGAVTETKGEDGRPRYYVYGKHIPRAFRGPRGQVNGRGRLRQRIPGTRKSELVKVPLGPAISKAFETGARTASDVLVTEFQKEVARIVRRTRV